MTIASKARKNKKRPLHPTGRLIKQLRKASGYTQEEIKTILGFQATSAISKIESRDFIPDLMRLQKLLSLIGPSVDQKRQILDYYGYQEAELPEKHEFVSNLKQKAQKGDILSALNTLFYLFVYEKDYTALIEAVQDLYNQNFYMPQAVRSCSREVEMILREIFSCRRLMAQGMLAKQNLAFEEALQRAEMANQLLELIFSRFDKKLSDDARLFLGVIRLHIGFCAENTFYGMLRLKPDKEKKSSDRFDARQLPKMRDVMQEIERQFPEYNLEEIRQMTLYVEREALYLAASKCEQLDQQSLTDLFADLGGSAQNPTSASEWQQLLKTQGAEKVLSQVWENYFKSGRSEQKQLKPTLQRFQQTLKAHQQVSNWDGSTAQTAIVSTFLTYPVLLARLGHFSWAQDVLNLLYLQLTVAETHYRWYSSQALCKGLEYIHENQLSLKKFNENKLTENQERLKEVLGLLEHIVNELRNTKSLNSPRYLHYTFVEEPVFYFVLLHAQEHPQLRKLPELKSVLAHMEALLQS